MDDIGTTELKVEETAQGRVARLTLANPAKLNALSPTLILALHGQATKLAEDAGLRAVILAGAGTRAFAAGADLDTLAKLDPDSARKFIIALHEAVDAVRRIPVPVIAMLRGPCLGGAMELAAACDIRVADTTLKLGMPEVTVGIPSAVEACLMPRLIGWGNASFLLLTGETVSSEAALRMGFVQRLCAPDELEPETAKVLAAVLAAGAGAVRAQKRIMRGWEELPEAEAIARSIDEFAAIHETGEPAEQMRRVLERRRKR